MSTNVHAFKETDLKRAIRSARAAGLDVTGIVITNDGAALKTTEGKKPEIMTVTADDIVAKLK